MLVVRLISGGGSSALGCAWRALMLRNTALLTTSPVRTGATYLPEKKLDEMPPDFKENPDRDIKNFPHPVRRMFPPKARLLLFPDTWFRAFYDYTGVTGPYLLVSGLWLFIMQKELLGSEHEMIVFLSRMALFIFIGKKFGTYIARWAETEVQALEKYRSDLVGQHLNLMKNSVETGSRKIRCYSTVLPMVYAAKRENVALQLEIDYRQRLAAAHHQVKQRLDYMVDVADIRKQFQRRNLVDWVVGEVKKSITPERERETLYSCLAHLKDIAARSQPLV